MTFPTLEGGVSWLRLYSSEASLDELMANLLITKARTALGSREIVVQIPAVTSYAADRAARLARLVGGAIYTGTSKHFVKYRDDRSPYGYDAVDIGAMPAQTDFSCTATSSRRATCAKTIAVRGCCSGALVRRIPGAGSSRRDRELFSRSRSLSGIIRYLWRTASRRRPAVHAALVERVRRETTHVDPRARCPSGSRAVPRRAGDRRVRPPGHAAVAVGYEHQSISRRAVGVPPDTFRVLAERSHRRVPGRSLAAIGNPAVISSSTPRDPGSTAAARPSRSASSSRCGRDGPAQARGRDADRVQHATARSGYCCVAAGVARGTASRSPIAASSSRIGDLDVIRSVTDVRADAGLLVPTAWTSCRACHRSARPALGHGGVVAFTPTTAVPDSGERVHHTRAARGREAHRPPKFDSGRGRGQVVNGAVGRFALWGFPDARITSCCPRRQMKRQEWLARTSQVSSTSCPSPAAATLGAPIPRPTSIAGSGPAASVELVAVDDARTSCYRRS
jgi:hypothetical protein